jgi:hypothetical protein
MALLMTLNSNTAAGIHGRYCGFPGPLPDPAIYCGCTWGYVLFRGQPVAGAKVSLRFGSVVVTRTTNFGNVPPWPYYHFDGFNLGLRRNNVATVTVEYNGQTVTRVLRSRPDDTDLDGGQEMHLVIPDEGEWLPEPSDGYTLALELIGNETWMGGTAGLQRRALTSSVMLTEDTGLSSGVSALAQDAAGRAWALGNTTQAAVREGGAWTTMDTGLVGTQRALALASDGSLWAGGDNGLSRYDGVSWQPQPDFNGSLPNLVMALHSAGDGSLWVATWNGGAARRMPNGNWLTYTVANSGLNGDRVGGLSETSDGRMWFALGEYIVPPQSFGGLSVYSPIANTWTTLTQTHGLPWAGARSVATADDDTVWVSTLGGGVAHAIKNSDPPTFTAYYTSDGLRSNMVSRIATRGMHVFVSTVNGIDRFAPNALGAPPIATIEQVSPISITTTNTDTLLYLDAEGRDPDDDARILGYEWTSDLDGPVCSLVTCTVDSPAAILRIGAHQLRLRVLDDEGMWSSVVTRTLVIAEPTTQPVKHRVYLAVVMR